MTGVSRPRAAGMLAAGIAVVAVVAAVVVVVAGADEGAGAEGPPSHAYRPALEGDRGGEVAVQYVDELRVWWRGPGRRRGPPAEPVVADGRYPGYVNVRTAGSTVAIRAPYDSVAPWDDETDEENVETDVFVVCVEGSCTGTRALRAPAATAPLATAGPAG